jgi:hypothetical protein
MSLTSVELDRIRYELGAAVTRIGAEPYITFQAVFSKAIAPYLTDIGSTSTTTVAAVAGGASTAIVVAANPIAADPYNAPGFVVGADVVVDVGPAREFATIAVVSSLSLTLTLSNAHGTAGAPYPVVLKGAEWIVRDIIARIDVINTQLSSVAPMTSGIKAVDEIEFFGGGEGKRSRNRADDLLYQRMIARDDLSSAIGVPNMWRTKRQAQRFELY